MSNMALNCLKNRLRLAEMVMNAQTERLKKQDKEIENLKREETT